MLITTKSPSKTQSTFRRLYEVSLLLLGSLEPAHQYSVLRHLHHFKRSGVVTWNVKTAEEKSVTPSWQHDTAISVRGYVRWQHRAKRRKMKTCPKCGHSLTHSGGHVKCSECGLYVNKAFLVLVTSALNAMKTSRVSFCWTADGSSARRPAGNSTQRNSSNEPTATKRR